tara:strand:+ start:293 stop:466 length:174 start_codon:yes stop_codon:yes gene_type:complete
MYQKDFSISTSGQGLIEITNQIEEIVAQSTTDEVCVMYLLNTLQLHYLSKKMLAPMF